MYAIIDIEGNGGGFREECIIDIAIYRYDGQKIVDQFISLVNPQAEITPFVQKLTGISPKMVKTAPKFHEIARRVIEITEGCTLVGHNIEFDYRMLRQSFRRLGYVYEIDSLDTIPLAKKLIPDAQSYSLGKLVRSLGIPLTDQHRAAGDARATLDLFKLLITKDTENEIIQRQFEETNAKTYVNKVKQLTQDLPIGSGILYFQNESGEILFTEFADDLQRSAKKLFDSKNKKLQEIQNQTKQIHYELTANALQSLLLLRSKGIEKRLTFPFGLFFRSGKYTVEKLSPGAEEVPLLRFKSYTQGLKAVSFLKTEKSLDTPQELEAFLELKRRNELWVSEGRTRGEKAFYVLERGRITAYGFFEFHTQLQSLERLNKLKLPVKGNGKGLADEMKLALLKGEVQVYPLPSK